MQPDNQLRRSSRKNATPTQYPSQNTASIFPSKEKVLRNVESESWKKKPSKNFEKINTYLKRVQTFEVHEKLLEKHGGIQGLINHLKIEGNSLSFKMFLKLNNHNDFNKISQINELLEDKLEKFFEPLKDGETKNDRFKKTITFKDYRLLKFAFNQGEIANLFNIDEGTFGKLIKGTLYESLSIGLKVNLDLDTEVLITEVNQILNGSTTMKMRVIDFFFLDGVFNRLKSTLSIKIICEKLNLDEKCFYKNMGKYNDDFFKNNQELINYANKWITKAETILEKLEQDIKNYKKEEEALGKKIPLKTKLSELITNEKYYLLMFLMSPEEMGKLFDVSKVAIYNLVKELKYQDQPENYPEIPEFMKNLTEKLKNKEALQKAALFFSLGKNVCKLFQGFYKTDEELSKQLGIPKATFSLLYKNYFGLTSQKSKKHPTKESNKSTKSLNNKRLYPDDFTNMMYQEDVSLKLTRVDDVKIPTLDLPIQPINDYSNHFKKLNPASFPNQDYPLINFASPFHNPCFSIPMNMNLQNEQRGPSSYLNFNASRTPSVFASSAFNPMWKLLASNLIDVPNEKPNIDELKRDKILNSNLIPQSFFNSPNSTQEAPSTFNGVNPGPS